MAHRVSWRSAATMSEVEGRPEVAGRLWKRRDWPKSGIRH